MKKRKLLLTAIALSLVLTTAVCGTWAYFTTYAEAKGQRPVQLGYETGITEEMEGLVKNVSIVANEKSEPVYVRVKAYTASTYTDKLAYTPAVAGDWVKKGDYWYYTKQLAANEATTDLKIWIDGIPEAELEGVNIVVMDEAIPVYYDTKAGKVVAYDDEDAWSMALDAKAKEGGDK